MAQLCPVFLSGPVHCTVQPQWSSHAVLSNPRQSHSWLKNDQDDFKTNKNGYLVNYYFFCCKFSKFSFTRGQIWILQYQQWTKNRLVKSVLQTRVQSVQFWWNVNKNQTRLFGPVYFDLSILTCLFWSCLFWPVSLALSIWTLLFALEPFIWIHLLEHVSLDPSIWIRLIGTAYLDPSFWTRLIGPVYLDLSICTCVFWPVYFDLSFWSRLLGPV